MALDDCLPCDCDPAQFAKTEQGFQITTVRILCAILAASGGGGGGGGNVNLTQVGGVAVTLGQKLMAASIPAVIASDQTWTGATNIGKAQGATFVAGDVGVAGMIRYTTASQLAGPGNGLYGPLVGLNGSGALLTALTRSGFTTDPVRAEDEALADGESGVVILARRQTTPVTDTSLDGNASFLKTSDLGYLYSDTVVRSTPTATNPSIPTATSTTLSAANAARRYLLIQNNSAANIMISFTGAVLTGIIPSTANPGIVLPPGASYESPAHECSVAAITCYQTSGGAIETVSVTVA